MTNLIPQLNRLKKSALPTALATWVAKQEAGDAGDWLGALDAPSLANVTREIAGFCQDAGFDLAWVTEEQVDQEGLRGGLETVVLSNVNAFYAASSVKSALELHKATVSWLNNPTARKHRAQTREIYTRLANDAVIPPASAEAILDTNRNRWMHVTDALHTAYQENPTAVRSAVQAVMLENDQASNRLRLPQMMLPSEPAVEPA